MDFQDREQITVEQQSEFLVETDGLCTWEQATVFINNNHDVIKVEDVTFEDAMNLLSIGYSAIPF